MDTPVSKHSVKHLARSKDPSKSLAIRVLKNKKSMTWMVKGLGKIIRYEFKKLCSKKCNSLLRSRHKELIHTFPWEGLYQEFSCHCPTLLSLLASAADSQSGRCNGERIVTMIVCILAKFRCSKLAFFQKMISAILFSAHTGTSVSINVFQIVVIHFKLRFTTGFRS